MEDPARDAYGRLRTSLDRQGERIGTHDMLIAAHALTLGVVGIVSSLIGFLWPTAVQLF